MKLKYSERLILSTAISTIIGAFLIWIFQAYYCNDPARKVEYDKNGNPLNLQQVIMVFRHGLRSPSQPINFTSNKVPVYVPDDYGQLTKKGKFQLYEMGKTMRRRYYDLITPYSKLISHDVRAVSTNMNRCFDSVALLLAGLYPPEGHQVWNRKLRWQPISITSETPDKAYLLLTNTSPCPLYLKQMNMGNFNNDAIDKLISYFSKYVNFSDNADARMQQLFVTCDALVSMDKMGIPLPDSVRTVYPDSVINFLTNSFCYIARNYQLQKLFSGRLLTDIVSQMEKVISRNDSSKIYLYAGHDTSITALLSSLSLPSCILPDYGASVIFELYSSQYGDYYVKVLYNEDTSFLKIETKILPQCEELCPLDKFINIVKPLFITDDEWKKECNSI